MSVWQCAQVADREVVTSLDTLCLSEADTWSKLSYAMLSQQSLQASKTAARELHVVQTHVKELLEDKEKRSGVLETLSKQLTEMKQHNDNISVEIEKLTKQLDISEARNITLTKEKTAITQELVVAQNTIRKLYKEVQTIKKGGGNIKWSHDQRAITGSLLASPSLWHPQKDTRTICVKDPVLPKARPMESGTPPRKKVSDTGGKVEVEDIRILEETSESQNNVVEDLRPCPRKRADKKAPKGGRADKKVVDKAQAAKKKATSGVTLPLSSKEMRSRN